MHTEDRKLIRELNAPLIRRPIVRIWFWLVLATSSAVAIEPAFCDILAIGLFGFAFAQGLRIPHGIGVAVLLVGLFLLGNLLASIFSPQPSTSLVPMAIRVFLIFGWWLLITSTIYEDPVLAYSTLWNGYTFSAVIAAALGTLAFFGVIPDYGQLMAEGRVQSLFKDSNVYGPYLVPPAIYALYKIEHASPSTAVLHLVIFCCLGVGLILGFSRGSWLNFAVALACYFFIRLRSQRSTKQRRKLLLSAFGVLVTTVGVVAVSSSTEPVKSMLDVRAKLVQYYDVGAQQAGVKSRFGVQLETLQMAMTNPIGIGAGQSEEDYFQGLAPHNLYLHVLVEAGWLGGIAFLAFLALTLWRSTLVLWQDSDFQGSYQVAFACLLGVLSQSFFVDSTHWRHLYLILAMLWGPALLTKRYIVSGRFVNELRHYRAQDQIRLPSQQG